MADQEVTKGDDDVPDVDSVSTTELDEIPGRVRSMFSSAEPSCS